MLVFLNLKEFDRIVVSFCFWVLCGIKFIFDFMDGLLRLMVGGMIWFLSDRIVKIVLIVFVVLSKWLIVDFVDDMVSLFVVLLNNCLIVFNLILLLIGVDVLWVFM